MHIKMPVIAQFGQPGGNVTRDNRTEGMNTNLSPDRNDDMNNISSNFEGGNLLFVTPEIPSLSITEQIELYGNLIVVPLGVVLNFLSFVIFYRIKTHKTATGLNLMCIALGDTLVIVGFFAYSSRHWTNCINLPPITSLHEIICKAISFVTGIGFVWSSLLLASATVERFISIAFTLKVKTWNLLWKSKILILLYFAVGVTIGCVWVYVTDYVKVTGTRNCAYKLEHIRLFKLFDQKTPAPYVNV